VIEEGDLDCYMAYKLADDMFIGSCRYEIFVACVSLSLDIFADTISLICGTGNLRWNCMAKPFTCVLSA